jgi:hypothetical protein
MSFLDCITNGNREGNLTDDQARLASDLYIGLDVEYQGKMNRGAAAARAAKETFESLQKLASEKKRKKLLQVQAFKQVDKNLNEYRGFGDKQDYAKAAEALIEQDIFSKYSSLVQRQQAIEQRATSKMYDVLATFKRNLLGSTRNKAQLKNMVREVFGEPTDDVSAKEFAIAWKETAEDLRLQFNRAGGSIPKRSDWGLPQQHDQIEVGKAGMSEWISFVKDRLDPEKMLDHETGLKMTEDRLIFALQDVWNTISSGGLNKVKPGAMASNRKSLANSRTDHRFLVFKNADAWLEYQEKFGNTNAFDVMMGHITSMSKEIAQMDILGPNPLATLDFIKTKIKQNVEPGDPKAINKANKAANYIDTLYNGWSGRVNQPIDGFFGNTFAGIRSILTSAQLGAASISAITDFNFQRITRGFVGLPQVSTVTDVLKLLNPLKAEEKGKLAVRLGLIAEGWTTVAAAQMRYVGDVSGPEITRRISDFVMRASFLSPLTQAGRWAFGMEFLGYLADQAPKAFNQLDEPIRASLQRYGIGSDKWDIIRSTDLYEYDGAKFLSHENIAARTDIDSNTARDLSLRVLEMINTETNFAVPSSSLRGKVALIGNTNPGTIAGELSRSFAMYKNFGTTLVNTHLVRGVTQKGAARKGTYLADFLITGTIMGALALQLKEMSKGRDPRPMTSAEFWGAAFMQSGGLGIFGDFLMSDHNRFGGGLAQTIAGPVVGLAEDVLKLTMGNVQQAIEGEDTNFASDMVRFAGRYTPGSSLWYSRLALERGILNQLEQMADPKAARKFRNIERKYAREYNQSYWWRPGSAAPDRSVDLSNLFEESR